MGRRLAAGPPQQKCWWMEIRRGCIAKATSSEGHDGRISIEARQFDIFLFPGLERHPALSRAVDAERASEAVTSWLHSRGHRADILDGGQLRIGVAMAHGPDGTAD